MTDKLWRTPGDYLAEGRDLWAEIKPIIAQGVGVTELAHRFSIKRGTMGNFINKMKERDEKATLPEKTPGRAGAVKKAARERYGKEPEELLREWFSDETVNGAVVAERLGVTVSGVYRWLKKLDIRLTLPESRRRAKLAKRYDHDAAIVKARGTLMKRSFVVGSGPAQTIGRLMKVELGNTPLLHYDVVIGENAWHVIEPEEVDLPVIVIRREANNWGRTAYTFAIEVDGHRWHEGRRESDREKDKRLNEAGWFPIRVLLRDNYSDTELEAETQRIIGVIREELARLDHIQETAVSSSVNQSK